jgi:hypothetical protein
MKIVNRDYLYQIIVIFMKILILNIIFIMYFKK